MNKAYKGRPPRLPHIFQNRGWLLYFVTINTHLRRCILANPTVHTAFRLYGEKGLDHDVGLGAYVIMPDHLHAFVRVGPRVKLSTWEAGLKRALGTALESIGEIPVEAPGQALKSYWQPGFFDHLLRQGESYSQKWEYVRQNPVRAGLVNTPDEWPYMGEVVRIDRV